MQIIRHHVSFFIAFILVSLFFVTGQSQAQEGTSISIPSIEVEAAIVEAPLTPDLTTWDVSHLSMNVGHLIGTGWFGTGSNIVLGGHSETPSLEADIFYNLDAVQVDDIIIVNANGTQYQYIVTQVYSVSQFDVRIAYPTQHEQLTLITCQRDSYDSSVGQYQNRVVVVAVPV